MTSYHPRISSRKVFSFFRTVSLLSIDSGKISDINIVNVFEELKNKLRARDTGDRLLTVHAV